MICILFKTPQTVFVQKMYQFRFPCDCIWFSPGYVFFSNFYIMSFLNIFAVCFMSYYSDLINGFAVVSIDCSRLTS